MTDYITLPRAVVEGALERLELYHHKNGFVDDAMVIHALRDALADALAEPVQEIPLDVPPNW